MESQNKKYLLAYLFQVFLVYEFFYESDLSFQEEEIDVK